MTLRVTALNNEVSALHVSEFAETLEQRRVKYLVSVRDKPNPPDLARLLGARTKWTSSYRATHQRYELAPLQSIKLHWLVPMCRDRITDRRRSVMGLVAVRDFGPADDRSGSWLCENAAAGSLTDLDCSAA